MKKKLRIYFWSIVGLCAFVALLGWEEDTRGRYLWKSYTNEWTQKGEVFSMTNLLLPEVPSDQNFAATPVISSTYLKYYKLDGTIRRPPLLDVTNQLQVHVYFQFSNAARLPPQFFDYLSLGLRQHNEPSKEPQFGDWQLANMTDLPAWQSYYHSPNAYAPEEQHPSAGELMETRGPYNAPIKKAKLQTDVAVPAILSGENSSPPADVLKSLSRFQPLIDSVRDAAQRPFVRFPSIKEGDVIYAINGPQYSLKSFSEMLALKTVAEIGVGQTEEARSDVKLTMYLARTLLNPPLEPYTHYDTGMAALVLQSVWEGCAQHQWKDGDLSAFIEELAKFDYLTYYERKLRWERERTLAAYESVPDGIPWLGMPDEKLHRLQLSLTALPRGWLRLAEHNIAEHCRLDIRPLIDTTNQQVSKLLITPKNQFGDYAIPTPTNPFPPSWLNIYWDYFYGPDPGDFIYAQAVVNLARVACGLERYYLLHHEYPKTLEPIQQWVRPFPHDLMDGKPLKYRREAKDHFVLYSIDWDGIDRGGIVKKTATVHDITGDWVWTYPTNSLPR